jgi:phosphoribulokinase
MEGETEKNGEGNSLSLLEKSPGRTEKIHEKCRNKIIYYILRTLDIYMQFIEILFKLFHITNQKMTLKPNSSPLIALICDMIQSKFCYYLLTA